MSTFVRRLSAGIAFAILNATIVAVASPQREALFRSAALYLFEEQVEEYAALHRKLEAPMPLKPSPSPYVLMVKREYLASAIKRARPAARQGDIFTPEVARLFREIIATAMAGRDAESLLRDVFDEEPPLPGFRARVYDPLPEWATHAMPVILLQALPQLPETLEYRLIDHDLVLWDRDADLIVDVMPGAVRSPST